MSPDLPIGELIRAAETGDAARTGELFAALYRELHAIAERELRRGGGDLTLGTTTLLHETYLNLASREPIRFPDEGRFLAYACRVMRGLMSITSVAGRPSSGVGSSTLPHSPTKWWMAWPCRPRSRSSA